MSSLHSITSRKKTHVLIKQAFSKKMTTIADDKDSLKTISNKYVRKGPW